MIITILFGIGSRRYGAYMPYLLKTYLGDILWGLMVFLLMGILFTNKKTLFIATMAAIFSIVIELSQLYHAPWIDNIRRTTMGALVLGFGFLWSDIICYLIGIGFGVACELFFLKRPRRYRI